jgi:replicative DNA helicase
VDEVVAAHRRTHAESAAETIAALDRDLLSGKDAGLAAFPTGFAVLDELLAGGLHPGELLLLGGPPGVGKTITALQWARRAALDGHRSLFACYEHEPATLLLRLLALELGELGGDEALVQVLLRSLSSSGRSHRSLTDTLGDDPIGRAALSAVAAYQERLVFVRASGSHTTLEDLSDLVVGMDGAGGSGNTVLFVDYLQKIPLHPEPDTEAEKVTRTVEGLKDLALEHRVPVVLLSAVDSEGMRSSRLRLYHLRGSSAIAFESDVVVMMNAKEKAVSKVHLSYDPVGARRFREWVVFSVEKNRGGPNLVDLEFRKRFAHFRFEPDGGLVSERLVDERLDEQLV